MLEEIMHVKFSMDQKRRVSYNKDSKPSALSFDRRSILIISQLTRSLSTDSVYHHFSLHHCTTEKDRSIVTTATATITTTTDRLTTITSNNTKMSSTTNTSSEPICKAVLLDMEMVEALQQQQQLNSPFLTQHAEDDNDHDALATQSSSSSTNTSSDASASSSIISRTATKVQILNFLTGLCTGVMFCCAGFTVLHQHWDNMGPKDVLLFSVVWGCVTSIVTCLLFSLLFIGTTRCSVGNNSSNSKCLESRQTISILENCFGAGIFLGFCGACTWTDVAYGTSTNIHILTVVVAVFWACLMIYCALATSTSRTNIAEEERVQPAQRFRHRHRRGTNDRKPAKKSNPKALASRKRTNTQKSPQKVAPKPVVPVRSQ
jgi:preprotein translocase subunit SecG